jgi:hypothetical protein
MGEAPNRWVFPLQGAMLVIVLAAVFLIPGLGVVPRLLLLFPEAMVVLYVVPYVAPSAFEPIVHGSFGAPTLAGWFIICVIAILPPAIRLARAIRAKDAETMLKALNFAVGWIGAAIVLTAATWEMAHLDSLDG